jgi:FkbM family methyltransferase
VSTIKKWRTPRGPRVISAGVGIGLTFDPGPSNPAYGVGDNELPVQNALATHLRPGDVFYDIGANVGYFTVIGARLVGPSGHVYAFEPASESAEFVRRNADRNGFSNVTIVQKAVSDTTGRGELVIVEYSGGAALSTATPVADGARVAVDLITIDEFVSEPAVLPPTTVKIDVEGVELEVLRGMADTIREHRPTIVCEIDDETQSAFDEKYRACLDFVRAVGYEVTSLEDSYPGGDWLVGHFVATPPRST